MAAGTGAGLACVAAFDEHEAVDARLVVEDDLLAPAAAARPDDGAVLEIR